MGQLVFQQSGTTRLTTTKTHDLLNRLQSISSTVSLVRVNLDYDSQSRRIQKIVSTNNGSLWIGVSTNRYLYDGWNLVAVVDHLNNLVQTFAWGSDLSGSPHGAGGVGGLLSMTVASGSLVGTYFYAHDGNGNVLAAVNAADGSVSARYDYGPFGEPVRATGPLAQANPFQFSTKFCDIETGLLYYGFRYYDPSSGRWPSRDPIGELGGINLYACVINNPISYVDTDGMQLFPPVLIEAPPVLIPRPIFEPIVPRPGIPPEWLPTPPGGAMPPLNPPVPIIPPQPGAPSPTPTPSPNPTPSPQPGGPLPPDQGGPPWQHGGSDCEAAELARLQRQMHAICDQSRSCRKCKDDVSEIWRRIRINEACIKARENIMIKCYRGGDQTHKDHVEKVRQILKDCLDAYSAAGGI